MVANVAGVENQSTRLIPFVGGVFGNFAVLDYLKKQ